MKEHEIVVGIDFGTTYSGVSWAIRSQDDYPNPIRVITNWPHPGRPNATNDKVPSVISYKNGIPSQWGYMAERLDDSCHWFKLRLDKPKNIEEPKHFKIRPRGLKKTAQDMAADYLRMIWEYTKSDISEQLGNIEWGRTHALKVILTVPAVWSATAKSRTLEAARIAGLPANIVLVPEPEAAALAILRDKDRMEETQLDDVFVICDAGGGTVDLITYKVKRLNPLQVGETAEGDGDFCGSVYLDEEFERHIAEIVQNYEKIQESQRRKMLEDFEYSIKRNFTLNSAQSYVVDLKGAADNLVKGVEGGSILLKPDTICAIFNKIYERIARLVDKQMEQVKAKGMNVKSIFLVGGFGDNYFLFDRLVECYSDSGIIILQADNGWSSVCRGATMWGLENKTGRTVTSRIARVSYGVSEDNFKMHWLQKKGEEIEDDEIKEHDLSQNVQFSHWDLLGYVNFKQTLFSSESATPPSYLDKSVNEHCSVECKLPCMKLFFREHSYRKSETRTRRHILNLKLAMVHRNAQLEFSVTYRGKKVAACVPKYMDGLHTGLYTKLEKNQIRYILIPSATNDTDGHVSIELKTTEFNREEEYEALSYAWGPQDDKTPIHLWIGNYCFDFPVANNLVAALKSLRCKNKARLLWIDALCINHQDPDERKSQLEKMHLYYRHAINVCIWLGEESDNSNVAMDFIPDILKVSPLEKPAVHRAYRPKWIALSKLLARDWFNRRWVIQETVLARKATVCCGNKTVSWPDFVDAVAMSDAKWDEISKVLSKHDAELLGAVFARGARTMIHLSSNLFRRDCGGNIVERLQDMENLLLNLRMFNVAHAADTVYAILELAKDTPDLGLVSVGSRLPPEELFTKVVMNIIKRSESLDTIFRPWAPRCPLPSWIPTIDGFDHYRCQWGRFPEQWNPNSLIGPPGKRIYNAADDTSPENAKQYSINHGNKIKTILSVSGIRADFIETIGELPVNGEVPTEWLILAGWPDGNYPVPADFWRTIVGDRDMDGQSPPGWYRRTCQHLYGRARADKLGIARLDNCQIASIFRQRVQSIIWNRRLIITRHRRFLGLAPADCQPNDEICILFGCSVPVVLRRHEKYYRLVGECYVQGMMEGEIVAVHRASGIDANTFEIF